MRGPVGICSKRVLAMVRAGTRLNYVTSFPLIQHGKRTIEKRGSISPGGATQQTHGRPILRKETRRMGRPCVAG